MPNGLLQIRVAEAGSRQKGIACEALNLFMAYTVKYLVSTIPMKLAQILSLQLHCFCSCIQVVDSGVPAHQHIQASIFSAGLLQFAVHTRR